MVASIIKRSPIKTLKGSESLVKNDTEIILSLANKLHYVCVRQEMGICGVQAQQQHYGSPGQFALYKQCMWESGICLETTLAGKYPYIHYSILTKVTLASICVHEEKKHKVKLTTRGAFPDDIVDLSFPDPFCARARNLKLGGGERPVE